jgi:hypothetical protein
MDLKALLVDKREDRFTTLLCSLFSNPSMLKRFVSDATEWSVDTAHGWRTMTQILLPGGFADILIEGPNRTAIVEAKLDSTFTSGQPVAYAEYLLKRKAESRDEAVCLVLLSPSSRLRAYEEIALSRLNKAGLVIDLKTISWEHTARIAAEAASAADPDQRPFLLAYADLIQSYVGRSLRPLTEAEVLSLCGPEARRGFWEALQLIDPIFESLAARLGKGFSEGQWSSGYFYTGKSLTWNSRNYWLGCWMDAWIEFGDSPIWLQMNGRKPILPTQVREELQVREFDGGLVCPLPLAPGIDREVQQRILAEIGERFIRSEE